MPKISPRLVKIAIIVITVFVLISVVSSIIQVVYLKKTLSSLPNTLFCTIDQSFKSVYGDYFSIFKNLDCGQNYFDNNTNQRYDFCDRFPNAQGCQ